jgi:hypothetical protein
MADTVSCSSISAVSFSLYGLHKKLSGFFQIEMFYDPGIAVAPGADTDLLEVELIEAEQVEGKYVQEIVPAEAEEVGQECSVLEPGLETDCAELGSIGGAEIVTALVYSEYKCGKMLAVKPNQSRSVVGRLGMACQIEEVPDEL